MSTDGGIDKGVDKGVRILSLDSGGPGTYSQLLIIKQYTARLAHDLDMDEADVYPADYFDLMGGVGFGGLVAILLGHLRMNVDKAIDTLMDFALSIFPENARPKSDLETNTKLLKESVEKILRERGIPVTRKMLETSEEPVGCKVALYAATTADGRHPIVMRTYKSRSSSINPTVVDAICATMATPSYFSPIKIGPSGRHQTFIGGPHGANNPTRELLKEASAVFGEDKLLAQVISLGCGRSRVPSMDMITDTDGVCRLVQEMAVDCETVEKDLATRLCDVDAYLRLNSDRGMKTLLMNEWDDIGDIGVHTNAYAETASISGALDVSLKRLQGANCTVTLGQINHPSTAKDMEEMLKKHAFENRRDIEDSHLLERLKPVDAPNYDEDRSCMEGTRAGILDEIFAWATTFGGEDQSNSTSNVLWLYGMPGVGKTSVANSLCHRLHRNRNLGGSFFCKYDNQDFREPKRVLPTLISKLVRMWRPFRKLVAQVLLDEPQINPESTRGELLLKPLQLLNEHPPNPLVIIIDALDECGQPNGRAPLLNTLIEASSTVRWLKIFVTSRPEPDIKSFFDRRHITSLDLAKEDAKGEDIRLFTERRMASVASRRHQRHGWPGDERVSQIVERSRGLFIFVETLSQLVDVPTPEPLLVEVLGGKLEEANAELHKLYSTVVTSRAVGRIEDLQKILRAVIAVSAYRPLCAETLAKCVDLDVSTVFSWVDELSSLIYQDGTEGNGIRVRHQSVLEFLVGSTCPTKFRVDQKLANSELTRYCFSNMSNELQFNICGLETSYVSNLDVHDLKDRVEQKISDALQYSCTYWSDHLCYDAGPASAEVVRLLDGFFAGSQPLYWIEVLSLTGRVPVAISALRLMKACFNKFEDRHQRLVQDALRFVLAFFIPISTSTPHIYISALPFTPIKSNVWECARVSFPDIISVCKGRMESWPAPSITWQGHSDPVRSVIFSPDGQNIASGSNDGTIRIWDVQTGAGVGGPLIGHTSYVLSVAYSPDGRNLVSGSSDETIRIWDAQTGAPVGQPLTGHTGWVYSIKYSLDGRNIVSGSSDETIRIWDVQTGAAVGKSLMGHTGQVISVAYSPDGRSIASGSDDTTIRIWDVQTGAVVGDPLMGHTSHVLSVAYSPDGRSIASGSDDKTIRIWDVQTGAAVGNPLMGHTSHVLSVAYSPDGRNIASGSDDETIRIWDAQTRAAVGKPLTGHNGWVYSVAYSSDGRNVVSGSYDKMVRVWDAQTRAAVGKPPTGHTGLVSSVACSPDSRIVVSGSSDNTIRIWDAQTGALVGQPLAGHTGLVSSVAYSPSGQNIVSGSYDKTIRIWNVQTGVAVGEPLTGHTGWVFSVAYSSDGRNVVSGSYDMTIRIWDAQTGVVVGMPLTGHTGLVSSVAYSPDGRGIVSGSYDSTVRAWDAQTGAQVGEPMRGHSEEVTSVAYSPNGRNFISGSYDKTIRIWDAQTGALVEEPLMGHTGYVLSVTYSPDGQNIASASSDKTVRLWDVQTGTLLGKPLTGHTRWLNSIKYSPDGRYVLSGSSDKTIRVWDSKAGIDGEGHGVASDPSKPTNSHLSLNAFSKRPIPIQLLDSNGWLRGPDELLFWVPEDCRNGLTCPEITIMPNTDHRRPVRIDFSHFQHGILWTNVRGRNLGGEL